LLRRQTRSAFVLIAAALAGACSSGATAPTPSSVTVNGPTPTPQLSVTKFLAFGDSITGGKSGTLALGDPYGFGDTGPTWSYPSRFQARLKIGYPLQAQGFVVTNAGCGGEPVVTVGVCSGTSGQSRLRQRLIAHAPEVLLLMEGVNDLNSFGRPAINDVLEGLHAMTKDAQSRGVTGFR
jgi:lysophospholipase L1-like esterase